MAGTDLITKGWSNGTPLTLTPPYYGTSRFTPNAQFFEYNGRVLWEKANDPNELKDIYLKNAPLASILNNSADLFVNGEIQALNSRTENKVRGINKEWQRLIDAPNWQQDSAQFFKQLYTYRKLFGWCYVLKIKSAGFDIPSSMWVLPNWLLTIQTNRYGTNWILDKDIERKVFFNINGQRVELDNADLILFTDVNNVYDELTWLPKSRIQSLCYPIGIIDSILEAEKTLIDKKGAIGIVSGISQDVGGVPVQMKAGERERLQEDWQKYGLSREKWQMLFSAHQIQYTPLVFDATQLQLKETYLNAIKDLCDGLHYPFILTAFSDISTYSNRTQAMRDVYQDLIMPDCKSIMKRLEMGLGADKANVMFWADYTSVDALKDDLKVRGDGLRSMNQAMKLMWDNGLCTKNMWLEKVEMDKVADPLFDKYKYELSPEELGLVEQNVKPVTDA